ncbi:hydrolase [Myxococcus landrumensis]|uniref:Hydrolase n=2 Tax=Myxococcus landrumensis TaxID=2813577 RepID=A0ABX7MY32_9BACT|nr:hydrolase [Myxococcus landrumus]
MRRLSAVLLWASLLSGCEGSEGPRYMRPPPFTQTFPDAGGVPDAGPVSWACQRASVVHGAPISLLVDLQLAMSRATSSEARTEAIDRFVAEVEAKGGTPLVSDASAGQQRVAFFVRGASGRDTFVAGEFNAWSSSATPLTQVRDTDLFLAEVVIPRTGPQPYKLVKGDSFFEDPGARHVVWDRLNRNDVGQFNSLVYPGGQDATKGRLTAWYDVRATVLGDARDVFVYTPARYDGPECPVLPVMYVHDGNESITRESFVDAADAHYAARPEDSAVLVFVALPSQGVRLAQYTFPPARAPGWPTPRGDEYLSFVKDDLMPKVEAGFRVKTGAADTGISGASLGGLISVYAGFRYPEEFGFVGTQSGTMFWPHDGEVDRDDGNAMVVRAGQEPVVPVRFYVDHGSPESGCTRDGEQGADDCQSNLQFVAALRARGYSVAHVNEVRGAHDWGFWKKRLPKMLCAFRNTDPRVCGL